MSLKHPVPSLTLDQLHNSYLSLSVVRLDKLLSNLLDDRIAEAGVLFGVVFARPGSDNHQLVGFYDGRSTVLALEVAGIDIVSVLDEMVVLVVEPDARRAGHDSLLLEDFEQDVELVDDELLLLSLVIEQLTGMEGDGEAGRIGVDLAVGEADDGGVVELVGGEQRVDVSLPRHLVYI